MFAAGEILPKDSSLRRKAAACHRKTVLPAERPQNIIDPRKHRRKLRRIDPKKLLGQQTHKTLKFHLPVQTLKTVRRVHPNPKDKLLAHDGVNLQTVQINKREERS